VNDWGGISPLTLDFINPEAPWPQVSRLAELAGRKGLRLRERLAVYPEFIGRDEFFSEAVSKALRERADAEGYPVPMPAQPQNAASV
jgi:FO synthase